MPITDCASSFLQHWFYRVWSAYQRCWSESPEETEKKDDHRYSCHFDGQFFSGVFRIMGDYAAQKGFDAGFAGSAADFSGVAV